MTDTYQAPIISWTADEFSRQEKDPFWFILFGVAVIILMGLSLWMKNYIFIIILGLAAFLIYVHGLREPAHLKYEITEEGIRAGKSFFTFKHDLESYWIMEDLPDTLSVEMNKWSFRHNIYIPIPGQDQTRLKEILSKYLKQKKQEEHLIDALFRKMGF